MAAPTGSDASLLERDEELAVLSARLEAARGGAGGLLVVEGPPGAGKSALLAELRRCAEDDGMSVRAASGGELEREFAFGVVRQLLEPVLRRASGDERAALLSGAAAHAGPVLGIGVPDPGADASFATLHGLYWLVAGLAERGPLVLVADDAHWADAPSLRFLDFLVRRAPELALLVAIGVRPGEGDAATADLLGVLADAPGATVLRPRPLSAAATAALLPAGSGEDVAHVAVETTGGNPLLLRELIRTLAADGVAPTVAAVREAVPSSVLRSVERRLRRLAGAAADAARALAVLGDVPADVLAAACATDAVQLAGALDALREADLVVGAPAAFTHPLVRQAVAASVRPAERDRLHAVAARELHAREGLAEQAVSHLLAAPPLREAWVVALLRDAARQAAADGAPELAARRLERAREELAPDDPDRAALRVELALAQMSFDVPAALGHLQVVAGDSDPVLAARALSIVLNVGAVTTPAAAADATARGEQLLALLAGGDHEPQVAELEAQLLSLLTLDPGQPEARARRLEAAAAADRERTRHFRAFEAACRGATRDEVVALVRAAMGTGAARGLPAMEAGVRGYWSFAAAVALELPDEARALVDAIDPAARRGSPFVSAFADYLDGSWQLSFGSIALAEAQLRGAREVFAEAGAEVIELGARGELVSALVMAGQLEEAEQLVAEVGEPDFDGRRFIALSWWTRRAELRLAQGRAADAVADLRRVEAITHAYGWQRFLVGRPGVALARALAAAGDRDEARRVAEAEADEGRRRGVAGDEAAARLVLGRVEAPAGTAIAVLEHAVDVARRGPVTALRGEAQLELGAALRRANRRADARAVLAQAREAAHQTEGRALERRASEELTIAGGRPRRVAVSGVDALTPAERRVAGHAAAGLSNREIAETLFVTRKTVEATLGAVFAKLGIRSRTQLPELLRT